MSELKAYTFSNMEGRGLAEYYIKSEADKAIALLTDKANYNDYAYKYKSEELADTCRFYEEELRRHKYKRCLAMAEWCDAESDVADADGDYEDMRWYQKWHQKWLELAEKFKEEK